jgi:hypothetical protein
MTTLIEQIKKAGEWDMLSAENKSFEYYKKTISASPNEAFYRGLQNQHAQMIWAVEALQVALAALNEYEIICASVESRAKSTPASRAKNKIAALMPRGEK